MTDAERALMQRVVDAAGVLASADSKAFICDVCVMLAMHTLVDRLAPGGSR